MDSSLRPRSRPIKDQTEEMLRPKSRLDAQKEKEKRQLQMKTFGDLEYRADLDKQLSWNPIARLGYDPDAHKVFKQIEPKTGLAFQGGGPRTIKKLKELGYEGAEKAQQGSVITTTNYSFSPVISHEFTHIGFDILKKRRNENPEAFDKKYGENAGKILDLTESGKLKEEYYIEFFDDLNTRFNTDMLPEDFKEFPKSTIRDTVQSYPSGPAVSIADRGEEKRNKRVAEIEKFQNIDLKRKEKGKKPLFFDGIDEGIFGLMDAAQDILTEQGEPPKTKMKTLSFWEKVGKSFSNLRPVGARGLYEGGLSVQTEEAFNTDAEGRRRRRPSQAYLERSKEGTGQVVENVLGALPGIGTAMTVEEIQEELQKDDPNYSKIALLGGSELIGLIPGLGTAAKAGLRKVASSIGADKIIKALDAPESKPESEIIAGPGATGYYDSNYDRAKELKERGYSPAQIEQMTGRFQTGKSSDYVGDIPENPFKFEIDDSRVEIKGSDGFQTLKESTRHYPIAVGHIIPTHTELFKEYPNLRNVAFYIDPKKTGYGAHFDPNVGSQGAIVFGPNNKSLTSPNNKNFRNTFFHELQHAAQFQDYKIAGLKQLGGNPVFLGRVGTVDYLAYKAEKDILGKNKNFVKLRDEILNIFEKQRGTGALDQTSTGATLPGQVPNPSEVFGDVAVAKKIARKMRELESELFKTYMRTVSEVEARVVGGRAEKIATVGSVPKPRVTSNLARERKIETLKEFQSDEPKSLMGKKVEDFKLKLGPMTDEEILRYARGGINFARYAKGIDKDLQGFDLFGPTKPNYSPSENIGFTPELKPFRENPDIKPEVEDAFTKLADIQRGEPELAMVEAQKIYGGGVMPYALEHAGDLTHRMAERGGRFGAEFVAPKVTRLLDSLLSDYGFEKEMLENIQSNARFHYKGDNPNISFEEYKKEYENNIDKALKKYSEAHKKVPVYNKMQLAGREAAIAIGEKRYTDAIENLYIIDQAIKDGTYKQAALEFDPNIDFRKESKDFNKGGTVMKRQMEMAFMKEGGLKDDGTRQDPVSGNEVPSGSMASEVRDDIPAQLSEGEYVVPADVVRYLGVKHFEDLRNKAKSGLQKMEADGRIGGEPVPVGGPKANSSLQPPVPYAPPMAPQMAMGGDLTPEEMQEINSIMMASGGMVSGAAAGSFYSPLSGITVEQAITTPTRYTGAFSWEKPQPTAPVKTPVTETPATCAARGMVYNPETKMCEVPTDIEVEKDLDRDKGGPPEKTPDPIAWSRDITDPVSWAKENNTSPIPGLFGKLGTLGNVARIEAMAIIARENNDEKTAKQLEAIVEQTIQKNSWIELVPEDLRNGTQIAQSLRKDTKTTSYINNIYSRPAFEKRQETRRAEVLANKEAQAKKDKKAAAKALKSLQKSNTRGGRSNVTGVNIDRDPMGMATMSTTYGSGSGAETFSATADDEGASTPSQGLGGMYSDGYTADVNKGGLMRKKKK